MLRFSSTGVIHISMVDPILVPLQTGSASKELLGNIELVPFNSSGSEFKILKMARVQLFSGGRPRTIRQAFRAKVFESFLKPKVRPRSITDSAAERIVFR